MTCQDQKDLMMAYLDNELNEQQKRAFEEHLAGCPDCTQELAQFRKLKQMTDCVALVEPEDRAVSISALTRPGRCGSIPSGQGSSSLRSGSQPPVV